MASEADLVDYLGPMVPDWRSTVRALRREEEEQVDISLIEEFLCINKLGCCL